MKINEIMSNAFEWIAPQTTLVEAARVMNEKDCGFLPIGENDRLIGTITDRDIVIRAVASGINPETTTVRDIMTPQLMYCFDDQDVSVVCQNMSEIKVRRLPVVNRDKRLVGIVSLGDVAQAQAAQSGEALQVITCHAGTSQKAAA